MSPGRKPPREAEEWEPGWDKALHRRTVAVPGGDGSLEMADGHGDGAILALLPSLLQSGQKK